MIDNSGNGMLRQPARGILSVTPNMTPEQEDLHHAEGSVSGKYRRSRTGCYTCRLRRKKCGEGKPICQACKSLKLKCDYKRPTWWRNELYRMEQKRLVKEYIRGNWVEDTATPMPITENGPAQQRQLPQLTYQPFEYYYTDPMMSSQQFPNHHVLSLEGQNSWGHDINQYTFPDLTNNYYYPPGGAEPWHDYNSKPFFMTNGFPSASNFQPIFPEQGGLNVPSYAENGGMAMSFGNVNALPNDSTFQKWCNEAQQTQTERNDVQGHYSEEQLGVHPQEDAQLLTNK
ncbi:hypothetical protein KEM54_005057, partial [Ascosphaera aggregata]